MEDEKREKKAIFLYQDGESDRKNIEKNELPLGQLERSLGDNIRRERELRGLTLEELAELTGLSSSYLGLLERGERYPSFKVLSFLLDFFSLKPNDLMLDESRMEYRILAEKEESEDYYKRLTIDALIRGLTDSELEFIIEYLKLYRKYRGHSPVAIDPNHLENSSLLESMTEIVKEERTMDEDETTQA